MFLKLNAHDQLIKLQKKDYKDKITIYKQFSLSTFKNLGQVQSGLTAVGLKKQFTAAVIPNDSTVASSSPSRPTSSSERKKPTTSNVLSSQQPKVTAIKSQGPPSLLDRASPASKSTPPPPPPPHSVSSPVNGRVVYNTPVSMRLLYVLPLGPQTAKEISKKTAFKLSDVNDALENVGLPLSMDNLIEQYPCPRSNLNDNEEYWVLSHKCYKDLKLFESRVIDKEQKRQLMLNCLKVYDALGYPSHHPSREYIARGRASLDVVKKDNKTNIQTERSNSTKRDTPLTGDETARQKEKRDSRENSRKSESSVEKKRKREDDGNDEDYYKRLAKKFKSKYKEYEKLYQTIQESKSQGKENSEDSLKRLFDLHKDLESWKKQLWSSVASK